MTETAPNTSLIAMTADIVSAYLGHSKIATGDIPGLIQGVFSALSGVGRAAAEPAVLEDQKPAVRIRKSITPDFLICLEDGRKFKSLKRHLQAAYNLSPEAYRAKWGLPGDYPMVAPSYAAARSALARGAGLGRAHRNPEVSMAPETAEKPGDAEMPETVG